MSCIWQEFRFKKELCHVHGKSLDVKKETSCTWQEFSFKKELCHVHEKRLVLKENYVMYIARV